MFSTAYCRQATKPVTYGFWGNILLSSNNIHATEQRNNEKFGSNNKGNYPQTSLPLLIKRREIAALLNVNEKTAISILARHGVSPIDLGRGRGNGLRWRTSAVIAVADILHTEAQPKKIQQRKTKNPFSVRGKSASELLAEFGGVAPAKAEVYHGN